MSKATHELHEERESAERSATDDLAASAQRFSRRTRHALDDKLTLTATLMRAGEVGEANRLLGEVEKQVRDEEAALFEQVNEVKVATVVRRERLTRLRLARLVAVAMLGASMLAVSAAGMAVVGFLDQSKAEGRGANHQARALERTHGRVLGHRIKVDRGSRALRIAGVRVAMSPAEFAAFEQLASRVNSGAVAPARLEAFLLDLVPLSLARQVNDVVGTAGDVASGLPSPSPEVPALAGRVERKVKKASRTGTAEGSETAEEPAAEDDGDGGDEPAETETTDGDTTTSDDGDDGSGDGGDDKDGGQGDLTPIGDSGDLKAPKTP